MLSTHTIYKVSVQSEIAHLSGLLNSRVPHYGRAAAALAHAGVAIQARIVDQHVGSRVEVDAIDLAIDNNRPGLLFFLAAVHLVEVRTVTEAVDRAAADVAHLEIGYGRRRRS